jgi:quercetin dioxygenase-like cupin family protein
VDEKDWEKKLQEEGFRHIYVWRDAPNAFYPDHTHAEATAHIILDGEMSVSSQGKTQTYKPGDRFDVPAHTIHSATMGPKGCRYLIGDK